ncbi:Dopamine N-acetyltransferase [Orchesella cincta]|uniref:aralkylamine N-acetyltransferase n=1 Tax=Orchesella cincta TaxID=48709 RepID=A0A1D2NKU2_ORCCI|nr:Dopamine N-acetyltransferase [Orchesella cincta]
MILARVLSRALPMLSKVGQQDVKYLAGTRARHSNGSKMIVYSRIAPSDAPVIAEHMLENFYKFEPFGLALGLTNAEVETWFPKFLDEVLNYYEPVSFMAKDTETNEIVGVAINIIMDLANRSPPPSMKPYLNKEKQPVKWQIVTFLEDLEEGVDAIKFLNMDASKTNKMFGCLFLSVSAKYGGKGIAKTLIRESEAEAKQLEGVTIATTDTTSQFSYLAFQKLGYESIKEVKYLSYKDHEGIPIFEGRDKLLGVHTSARVVAKKL